jgi:nucleoside-diphosphate-sugar epimerase
MKLFRIEPELSVFDLGDRRRRNMQQPCQIALIFLSQQQMSGNDCPTIDMSVHSNFLLLLDYPKYKIQSELFLQANLPAERFSCVRPCVVFGNGDTTITPRAVAFLKSSPFVIHFGKWRGKNRWPLAHVENVCRTLHGAMLAPEAGGKGATVLDTKYTTLSDYYRELAAEYLPEKKIRELCLPRWTILPAAWVSSTFSGEKPLFDPTLYALDTITSDLNFSNDRMKQWIAAAGEKEFVQ